MKSDFMNKVKRIISVLTVFVILITMFPSIMVSAEDTDDKYPYTLFAASDIEGAITINADNFCVNGNIATNGTVVSKGNMNINGTIVEHAGQEMIYIPERLDRLYFSGENVERFQNDYAYEEMNININTAIDAKSKLQLTGNANINAGVKSLGEIVLSGESININNSIMFSEENIEIDGLNVNLNGLIYAPYGDVVITAQSLNMNSVIIIANTITINCSSANANYNSNIAGIIGTESDYEIAIIAFGDYNAENNSIEIYWETNSKKGVYEIFSSNDNEDYYTEASILEGTSYKYQIYEEFDIKYFKVSVTLYGDVVESVPFIVKSSEDGYTCELLDSDEDGLPDIYENMVGSDVNNIDTDNDGLTDAQEVCLTGTDPTKYDSFTENVSDADADSDGDTISNIQEILLGTDPLSIDTDDDGLSDSDEIYLYQTDPLVPDTDGDGLADGEEPHLGLVPTNPETFNIPDAQYKVKQSIAADSEALAKINTEDSPYKLSIDITAAGYVEGNLTAKETSYIKIIQNDSIIGIAPELRYIHSESIESVTLKFEISEEYFDNSIDMYPGVDELSGIKRLNVFKYFEDLNMLLPVETQFDIENNIVFAEIDELGTYCIIDMGLWLNSLNSQDDVYEPVAIKPIMLLEDENTETFTEADTIITHSGEIDDMPLTDKFVLEDELQLQDVPQAMSMVSVTPVDVTILFQSSGQLENTFRSQKKMIIELMEKLVKEYGISNVRFCIISYDTNGAEILKAKDGSNWFISYNDAENALFNISYNYTTDYTNRGAAFQKLLDEVTFRENSSKFIFQIMNGSTNVGSAYFDQIDTCAILGINYSEFMPEGYYYLSSAYEKRVKQAIEKTNGLNEFYGNDSATIAFDHICAHVAPPQISFTVIVPTGWKEILLDDVLDPENHVDSDRDNLTDWEEVKTEMISWDTDGTIILPTIGDCILGSTKTYVQDAFKRFQSEEQNPDLLEKTFIATFNTIMNTNILPIKSDPTNSDTDNDGILDDDDNRPFIKGYYSEDVDDIVIGNLTIVSADSKAIAGHSFLIYESFVNDTLDFTEFYYGFEFGTWQGMEACEYSIGRKECVTIGNSGTGFFNASSGSSTGSFYGEPTGSDGGIFFNREFEMIAVEDAKYYSDCAAIDSDITQEQLDKVIKYCNENNYYNLITNNCAKVACGAWNLAFEDDLSSRRLLLIADTPGKLQKSILKQKDSYYLVLDYYVI